MEIMSMCGWKTGKRAYSRHKYVSVTIIGLHRKGKAVCILLSPLVLVLLPVLVVCINGAPKY